MVYTCDPRIMEAEESGVQGHFQLHSKLDSSLDYMRPCLKQTKNIGLGLKLSTIELIQFPAVQINKTETKQRTLKISTWKAEEGRPLQV